MVLGIYLTFSYRFFVAVITSTTNRILYYLCRMVRYFSIAAFHDIFIFMFYFGIYYYVVDTSSISCRKVRILIHHINLYFPFYSHYLYSVLHLDHHILPIYI